MDNTNDNVNGKLRRVEFDGTQDGVAFVNPRDTALIRNYIGKDHKILGRDLVFVADGTGGLKIVLTTARDGAQIAKTERRAEFPDPDAAAENIRKNLGPTIIANGVVATANAQGVDVVSSDLSDEFVYVADGAAGVKVVDIHQVFTATGPRIVGQADTPGFANKVRIAGNFLYVADGASGLTVVDVTDRSNPRVVTTVGTGGNALDVAVYGVFAFVANGANGMAVVDISDEHSPRLVTTFNPGGVINDARGIDYADNRAYLADGKNGLRIVDITVPAQPKLLFTLNADEAGRPIDDAESVTMATVPFRTFAMLCDGKNGLHAVNVTDFRDIRERLFKDKGGFMPEFPENALDPVFQANFNLTLALRDPLTPFDRANFRTAGGTPTFQIVTFRLTAGQRILRIARGRQLDKLADEDGRTLRDSTAVGAGAMSRREMDKMRNVNVVVEAGTEDDRGNGLGNIVLQHAAVGQARQSSRPGDLANRMAATGGSLTSFGALFACAVMAFTIGIHRNRRSRTLKQRLATSRSKEGSYGN